MPETTSFAGKYTWGAEMDLLFDAEKSK